MCDRRAETAPWGPLGAAPEPQTVLSVQRQDLTGDPWVTPSIPFVSAPFPGSPPFATLPGHGTAGPSELSLPSRPSAFLEIRQTERQGCDRAPATSQPVSSVLRTWGLKIHRQCSSQGAMEGGRRAGRRRTGQPTPTTTFPPLPPATQAFSPPSCPVSSGTTSSKIASDLRTADSACSPVLLLCPSSLSTLLPRNGQTMRGRGRPSQPQ